MIPKHLKDKFVAHMQANDHDDMPDGAWFAMLEEAGESFLKEHKLKGDGNDAALFYVECAGKEV